MEVTGHYWLSLFSALTDNGFNVSVYNPYQVKSYRGAYNNRKQKNDIIDSIIIADYLRVFGFKESKLPEENLLSLKPRGVSPCFGPSPSTCRYAHSIFYTTH